MNNHSPYHNFIENLDDQSFKLEKKEFDLEESLVQLMIEIRHQKFPKSFDVFDGFKNEEDIDSYSDYEKALLIEANILALSQPGQRAADLVPLAKEALALYPEAAISQNILSTWEFQKKVPDEGIRILLGILEIYPGAKWVYHQIVRMLCSTREYKKAIPFIEKLESKTLRFLYFMTIRIVRPAFWFILVGYPLGIIIHPSRLPFLFVLETVFIIVPLIVLFSIAVLRNEKVLVAHYDVWVFLLLVAVIIATAISH